MGIRFNADEILTVAEQIERNGAEFYRKAAESAAGQSAAELLLELAAMEDDHLRVFTDMKHELTEQDKEPSIFDPAGESELYLRALASGHVFDVKTPPAERLRGLKSLEDILKFAIGIEKDSVVYYTAMKDMVPEHLGRTKMDGVVKEEIKHIALLAARVDELNEG